MRNVALLISVVSSLTLGSPQAIGTKGSGAPNQTTPPATSYQLIDQALAAKHIDDETAHKYRVFAAFGDSRLPAAYRGHDRGLEESLRQSRRRDV